MTIRRTAVTLAVLLALVAGACGSSSKDAAPATKPATSAPPTTAAPPTTTAGAPTKAAPAYAVGKRTLTVVDPSRPTAASPKRSIAAVETRTLPLLILYPATGTAGSSAPVADRPVADGRFPVIEFSHGVTASGPAYTPLLQDWAAAGYVVIAPTFPLTSGGGAWGDLGDYKNQPADISFILDEVLALDTTAEDPLAGHLATSEVAVAGHSLGAITTLGFFNSCCGDDRIKAAIEVSGVELPYPAGDWDHSPKTPVLLIHGEADPTVPYRGSANAYAKLPGPRAFITAPEAGHTNVLFGEGYHTVSLAATVAFLDLELRDDPTRWNELDDVIAETDVATMAVAGGMPAPGQA